MSNTESTLMICCCLETAAVNPEFRAPPKKPSIPPPPVPSLTLDLDMIRFSSSIVISPELLIEVNPKGPEAEKVMSSVENFCVARVVLKKETLSPLLSAKSCNCQVDLGPIGAPGLGIKRKTQFFKKRMLPC